MFIITYDENFAIGDSLEEALENYNAVFDQLSNRDLKAYGTWYEAKEIEVEFKTSVILKNVPTIINGKKK